MSGNDLKHLHAAADAGKPVDPELALSILDTPKELMPELFAVTSRVREVAFPGRFSLCSIVNAKSGACSEDCRFCAQSAAYATGAAVFPLKSKEEIAGAHAVARKHGVRRLGIVTSGHSLSGNELDRLVEIIAGLKNTQPSICASLGCLSREGLDVIGKAGGMRYHHNLETAASFFPSICSTHSYDDRIRTIGHARDAGMELCVGGILGLGETLEQRVELAMAVAELNVDSIPLNFLVPVKGTSLENMPPMLPLEILRCVAMFRMTNPRAEIRVCGGSVHLGELRSWIFLAGASGIMTGDLLTTSGRDPGMDARMLERMEVSGDT